MLFALLNKNKGHFAYLTKSLCKSHKNFAANYISMTNFLLLANNYKNFS